MHTRSDGLFQGLFQWHPRVVLASTHTATHTLPRSSFTAPPSPHHAVPARGARGGVRVGVAPRGQQRRCRAAAAAAQLPVQGYQVRHQRHRVLPAVALRRRHARHQRVHEVNTSSNAEGACGIIVSVMTMSSIDCVHSALTRCARAGSRHTQPRTRAHAGPADGL
jgi:hypothetical protein